MSYSVGQRVWLDGPHPFTPGTGVEVVGTLQNREDWYNVRSDAGGPIFAVHESRLIHEA